jgi:hypothetical protein
LTELPTNGIWLIDLPGGGIKSLVFTRFANGLIITALLSAVSGITAFASVNWTDQANVLKILNGIRGNYPDDTAPAKDATSPLEKEIQRRLGILGEVKINLMGSQKFVFDHPYVMQLRYIALNDDQISVRAEALRTLQAIALKDLTSDSSERLNTVKANSELSHLTEVQVLELMVGEIHDRLGIYRASDDAKSKIDSPVLW